jgi:hypothetical protein
MGTQQYVEYTVTQRFLLGGLNVPVEKDTTILFDGTRVMIDGQDPVVLPQLRGAIKAGWLKSRVATETSSLAPATAKRHASPRAGIRVGPAQGGNVMDPTVQQKNLASTEAPIETGNVNTVRTLRTSAKSSTNLGLESLSEINNQLNNVQIDPAEGQTVDEALLGMPTDEAAFFQSSMSVGRDAVSKRIASEEGISSTLTLGTPKTSARPGDDVVVQDGVRITNTNGPGSMKPLTPRVATTDTRRKVARSITPDFPDNYDFDQPVKRKVARLVADYGDRQDVLRAAVAAETSVETRDAIMSEFPEIFV